MTRTVKKKKELTLEEKLAEALVPVEKQPYKVPENWCWVYHNSILDISGGSQPAKSYFISECKEGYIQLYQTRDYGEHPVPVFIPEKYATKTTDEGDILLARYGGSLGKVFRAHKGAYNVALAKIIKLFPSILNDEYLYQYYLSHFYQEFCIKAASGRSAQSGFNRNDMEDLLFPLPPLLEQQRIVERIESLFSKLDEAKEKAQAVVDGFEDRKAAILHKAFTGELTEGWRKNNGVSFASWNKTPLESVCKSIFDGDHMPPPKSEKGIPFLVISNVNTGHLSYKNTRYVPQDYYDSLTDTRKPELGDLLYTLVGSYGIPVIVDDERPFCFQRHMALLKPDRVDTRFLWYQLQSHEFFNKATEIATGTAQLTVPIKGLRKLAIVLPLEGEQHRIVEVLDKLFSKEQQAKEAAEQVISQIDTMKKSILARAFRGELGTNDPADESAIELLKRVL